MQEGMRDSNEGAAEIGRAHFSSLLSHVKLATRSLSDSVVWKMDKPSTSGDSGCRDIRMAFLSSSMNLGHECCVGVVIPECSSLGFEHVSPILSCRFRRMQVPEVSKQVLFDIGGVLHLFL